MSNERGKCLLEAHHIINAERQDQYGKPEDNFETIGKFWEILKGEKYSAHDVALFLAVMKIARIITGTQTHDSYIDACGYLAIAADMAEQEKAVDLKPGNEGFNDENIHGSW